MRIIRTTFSAILFILIYNLTCERDYAQEDRSILLSRHYDNLKFTSLTVNDGLSEDRVSCVLQDNRGFMWFGTTSGLNRYDGYNFKIYRYDPNKIGTISSNYITRLYEDREGTLWVGTLDGGLNKFENSQGHSPISHK